MILGQIEPGQGSGFRVQGSGFRVLKGHKGHKGHKRRKAKNSKTPDPGTLNGIPAATWAANIQFLHSAAQGIGVDVQNFSGARSPFNDPIC